MDYEKIKQLMDDMGNSKLSAMDIDFPDGTKISMKKENTIAKEDANENKRNEINEIKAGENNLTQIETKKEIIEGAEELKNIKSPMVGTFYLKPSPTQDPYVEIGTNIKKGQTVCIIEAMKLMNEIESEFDGEIVEIYVKDGETVEYGTKLFGIK